MAILRAQCFDLEFSYYNINRCNEIEYSLSILLNGKPLFNPQVLSQNSFAVINEKFRMVDCFEGDDWLQSFFTNILKTKKGSKYETTEVPAWFFQVITWQDQKEEKEKLWLDKTVKTLNKNGEIVDEPYSEVVKIFIPLWENDIELIIVFPEEVFDTEEYSSLKFSFKTKLSYLTQFLEDFSKEMKRFYHFFGERVNYLGNGKYEKKEDFTWKFSYTDLDEDLYFIQKRKEWNNEKINSLEEIILELLLNDIRWRGGCIVGTVRYFLKSDSSEKFALDVFSLANKNLETENNEEIIKRLHSIKSAIAIAFPKQFSLLQLRELFSSITKEDIPEEIFIKNEKVYLESLP